MPDQKFLYKDPATNRLIFNTSNEQLLFYNDGVVLDNLVLYLDAASSISFRGEPTTNITESDILYAYNNVPSDVTASLNKTSDTYKGAFIWKETLTPTTANGVSYLSNANNPGIGVLLNYGGGLANRYTGYSIFYKSSSPLYPPAPIYTHYSNIPGYQSTSNYDDMGNGWYRANVIWYDTVGRTDAKFWAINPNGATLNVPIDVYWCGPFKEDRNDSVYISPYVLGTRGATVATGGGWKDLSGNGNNGELISGVTYNSANMGSLNFDGSTGYFTVNDSALFDFGTGEFSVSMWINYNDISDYQTVIDGGYSVGKGILIESYPGQMTFYFPYVTGGADFVVWSWTFSTSTWYNIVLTRIGTSVYFYVNSVPIGNPLTLSTSISNYSYLIGKYSGGEFFKGKMSTVQIYNKSLSAPEVLQNYNALKSRFI